MAQVPFPMRNSVLEEGKKSSKRGAMLLVHATLPFMSAYVEAIKSVKRRQKRHGAKLGPKDTYSPPNSLLKGCRHA